MTLFNAGNEIAGHTVDHANLKPLTAAEAEHQVCDDRNTLLAQGFAAESFAYPFGSFDTTSEAVVHYCGYNSGRGVAGHREAAGPFGETIPPADAYATRTPPNPKKSTKLSTLELYVHERRDRPAVDRLGAVRLPQGLRQVNRRALRRLHHHPGEAHRVPGLPPGSR